MKQMRKILALVLALMLCAVSLAAPGDEVIYSNRNASGSESIYFSHVAYLDGTVFAFSYETEYYTWSSGEDGMTARTLPSAPFETEDEGVRATLRGVAAGEGCLYLLVDRTSTDAETGGAQFEGMYLYRAENEGGELSCPDEPAELDWDELVEEYEDDVTESSYAQELRCAFVQDGLLVGVSSDEDYNPVVASVDPEDGDVDLICVENMDSVCPYEDGKVLVSVADYSGDKLNVKLCALDLESEDMEEKMQIETENWDYPYGLCYDSKNDFLYYGLSGELFRVTGFDPTTAQSVAALAIQGSGQRAFLTEEGYYIASDYSTIVMRGTDPSLRSAEFLRVCGGYNEVAERAYFDFIGENPDVEVVLSGNSFDVIQAITNHSDAVDVYVLYAGGAEYQTLLERGYLAELNGSHKLTALADRLYPFILDNVTNENGLVALPLEYYTSTYACNPAALAELGISEEEIPTSWDGYLDLLAKLADMGLADSGYYVCEPYYSAQDLKYDLVSGVFRAYLLYLQSGKAQEQAFDTPILRGLLEKIEQLDYEGLGLPATQEDVDYEAEYDYQKILIQTWGSISPETYSYTERETNRPMPLALVEGEDPQIAADLTVAVVNPYSKHPDQAVRFVEYMADALTGRALTMLCVDQNEPIPNEGYQETLDWYEEELASLRKELEQAGDEETKAIWQTQIDEYEKYRDEYEEKYLWEVSEESIAYFRQYAPYFAASSNLDEESGSLFYDLIDQYQQGSLDLDGLLKNLDKKLNMMLKEDL